LLRFARNDTEQGFSTAPLHPLFIGHKHFFRDNYLKIINQITRLKRKSITHLSSITANESKLVNAYLDLFTLKHYHLI